MMAKPCTWHDEIDAPKIRREAVAAARVVSCFADRPKSLFDVFTRGLAANPAGTAIVFEGQRITYAALEERVRRTADGLTSLGVVSGARVAILLANCPEYVVLTFALARLNAIMVPMNIREATPELAYIINDSQAGLIIAHAHLQAVLPDGAAIPAVRSVVRLEADGSSILDDLSQSTARGEAASADEHDVAVILYTSGTTGRPKGAMLSHFNVIHSFLHYQTAMEITAEDRSIIAVPMSHVTGLIALVTVMIGSGATLIIMDSFSARDFIGLAARERMTHTLIVPAMFNLCLLQPDFATADLSHWRISGYGGAIMPQVTIGRLAEQLPQLKLMNCYGATETTSPAVMMPTRFATQRAHQVGLPVLCADIMVMDANGREVISGTPGEIWISGPMVVSGYWNNPEATSREFVGGYWRSGDIGSIDDQGFVQVIDRLKDVINRGGYKIYASEVENILLDHAGVREAAVIGIACPVLGERAHAYIVTDRPIAADSLKAHCGRHLADYKVPERFHHVEALPRNANGKVLKRTLRELAAD